MTRPPCRNCGCPRPNRPRGLCWACYYSPGVRERYSSTSKFANRDISDFNGRLPLPLPIPTRALPGTADKLVVLAERAQSGQGLWHPLDGIIPGVDNAERK